MASALAKGYKDTLVEALRSFQCCKDADVQDFLNNKAIDFEIRGWATTYLLLSRKEFDHNKLKIEGYFSLTHKAVIFAGNVSLSARKKLAGSKKAQTESFVLIGQLGKNISLSDDGTICASKLSAKELLDDAIRIIQYSSNYIICRNIIIECKPIKKIKDIYESYGFTDLQYDENDDLHTLYLRLENQITF